MRFAVKLDESLSLAHVDLLRQAGYDADRIDQQGLSGATDEQVWERLRQQASSPRRLRLGSNGYMPAEHRAAKLAHSHLCPEHRANPAQVRVQADMSASTPIFIVLAEVCA